MSRPPGWFLDIENGNCHIECCIYQVNCISAGLSATGKKKWLTTRAIKGKMATKSVIFHGHGNNSTPAATMPAQAMQNKKVNLKRFKRRGISSKNETASASFAVAPQVILISKK